MKAGLFLTKYFGALLLLLSARETVFAQAQQWQKITLADSVTVEFPGQPAKRTQETKLGQMQAYVLNDGLAVYTTVIQKDALEPESSDSEIRELYGGALRGMKGQVVKKSSFTVRDFSGVEARLTVADQPHMVRFMRVVAVNGTVYLQQFLTSVEQSEALAASRQRFFASLQPKVAKADQVAEGTRINTGAYRLGKLLGQLTVYGFLLFLFIKLIRRFDKPKKNA